MASPELSEQALAALRSIDTPTVCNALEAIDDRFRTAGFSTKPFVCADPRLPPIVGYARTARISARQKPADEPAALRERRLGYYRSIEDGPQPSIVVIEDTDPEPGFGAFWGEVNSAIHKGLNCLGVITNGSIRDLDDIAPDFQLLAGIVGPSHAWVSIADFGSPVSVHGLKVEPGDLLHADQHGVAVIPHELAEEVPFVADRLTRREAVILEAARAPGFTTDKLAAAWGKADDIH